MKNLLLSVFTVLLIVLTIITMAKGIQIGGFQILGIGQIKEESDQLSQKVSDVKTLNDVTYKNSLNDLNEAIKKLSTAKSAYLDVASVSSDSEIKAANQSQTYSMEFLWSKIGNHATSKGVNIKMEVSPSGTGNNLNFTVTGSYIAIRNFIYALENDTDLSFKIEKFKMTSNGSNLTSTFTVSNIAIKQETLTTSNNLNSSTNSNTTSNTTNTTNTTNTSATTNNSINSNTNSGDRIDNAVQ